MIEALTKSVRRCWFEAVPPGGIPRDLVFLLSGDEACERGEVHLRVFRRHDPRPLLLVKIPRETTARRAAIREYDFLQELAETAPDAAGSLFPRPLFLEDWGNRVAVGETLLLGVRVEREIADGGADERALRAAYGRARTWLDAFWSRTGLLEGNEGALWEPFREAALFYLDTYDPPPGRRESLEDLIDEMEARRERTASYVFGHGDLVPANLIAHGEHVGAVNWAQGRKRQFPWVDPLHFAVHVTLSRGECGGRSAERGLERGFLASGWLAELNREFLADFFARSERPPDLRRLALPAFLLYSLHRCARSHSIEHRRTREWKELVDLGLEAGSREFLAA